MTQLKGKDKVGLACAAIAVALVAFMACFIPLGPYKDYQGSKRQVARLKEQLDRALETEAEERQDLERQEELMARIRQRAPDFDLSSFIIKTLKELDLDKRADLTKEKPNTRLLGETAANLSMVQLKLEGVNREELVDLLHRVYDSDNLVVMHKLDSLRPGRGEHGLDCDVTFVAPKA